MRSSITIFLGIILFCQPCTSQTKAKITDVDFHLEDRYIIINYNIVGSLPKEEMTIDLKFITENNDQIIPKTTTGDIGTKLFGEGAKTILWDIVADQVIFSGNIKASVTITSSKILYSGPGNAFLSIIIPGLGGYFVDKNKTMSVLKTLSIVGFATFGLTQKIESDKSYEEYLASTKLTELDGLYNKANKAHHNSVLAMRVAAGIWAFDIIYVTFKGINNRKKAKNAYSSFNSDGPRLYYVNNGLQFGYSLTFKK